MMFGLNFVEFPSFIINTVFGEEVADFLESKLGFSEDDTDDVSERTQGFEFLVAQSISTSAILNNSDFKRFSISSFISCLFERVIEHGDNEIEENKLTSNDEASVEASSPDRVEFNHTIEVNISTEKSPEESTEGEFNGGEVEDDRTDDEEGRDTKTKEDDDKDDDEGPDFSCGNEESSGEEIEGREGAEVVGDTEVGEDGTSSFDEIENGVVFSELFDARSNSRFVDVEIISRIDHNGKTPRPQNEKNHDVRQVQNPPSIISAHSDKGDPTSGTNTNFSLVVINHCRNCGGSLEKNGEIEDSKEDLVGE